MKSTLVILVFFLLSSCSEKPKNERTLETVNEDSKDQSKKKEDKLKQEEDQGLRNNGAELTGIVLETDNKDLPLGTIVSIRGSVNIKIIPNAIFRC